MRLNGLLRLKELICSILLEISIGTFYIIELPVQRTFVEVEPVVAAILDDRVKSLEYSNSVRMPDKRSTDVSLANWTDNIMFPGDFGMMVLKKWNEIKKMHHFL